MILYPNAKINVGLNVGEKRSDGYHEINSQFYPIPLYDILEVIPSENFVFQTSGIPINQEDNVVIQAFELVKAHFQVGNVFIHLHKQIPLGAGLGGGSSDAVFCMKALIDIFNLNISKDELMSLSLQLGSDCPFFVDNVPAQVEGRGEILKPTKLSLKGKYLKLIYPDIHISTQEAFNNIIRKGPVGVDELSMSDLVRNDFENWAFEEHPALIGIKEHLLSDGAYFASMSGSGSSIYGLYHNKPVKSTEYPFEKILLLE